MKFLSNLFSQIFNDPSRAKQPERKSPPPPFPPTFGAPLGPDEKEEDLVFDPSTQHYARAFRRGDPRLPPNQMQRWHQARRQVMQHLLEIAVTGTRADQLVLRGSLTMKALVGDAAREPGDIDWVIVPESIRMNQAAAQQIIQGIIRGVTANPHCLDAAVDVSGITQTDIWTYDRAPGRRVAFPWRCRDLPAAVVQMDFVFEQKLHTPPHEVSIDLAELGPVSLMSASCEESLAWKLLWLCSDIHPQGKDLYDAVLLAEKTTLSAALLKQVFADADYLKHLGSAKRFPFEFETDTNLDWENFLKECPWVSGTAEEWMKRLQESLRPTVIELRKQPS